MTKIIRDKIKTVEDVRRCLQINTDNRIIYHKKPKNRALKC